jgi:predicted deacylase
MTQDIVGTFGMHGDENSPLLLQGWFDEHGIPFVGPVHEEAWEEDKRFIDRDPNRIFGEDTDAVDQHAKERFKQAVEGVELVIDVHSFRMDGEPMVLQLGDWPLPRSQHVWDIRAEDMTGTSGEFLQSRGITVIPVEIPSAPCLTRRHLTMTRRILDDIVNDCRVEPQRRVARTVVDADHSGVFVPRVKIGDEVSKGERLGVVKNRENHGVHSPSDGLVGQLRPQDHVRVGNSVAGIEYHLIG